MAFRFLDVFTNQTTKAEINDSFDDVMPEIIVERINKIRQLWSAMLYDWLFRIFLDDDKFRTYKYLRNSPNAKRRYEDCMNNTNDQYLRNLYDNNNNIQLHVLNNFTINDNTTLGSFRDNIDGNAPFFPANGYNPRKLLETLNDDYFRDYTPTVAGVTFVHDFLNDNDPVFGNVIDNDETHTSREYLKIIYHNILNNTRRQFILTGAPGTGKTYGVKEFVKKSIGTDVQRYKFVQFHPSYDYTDFVEGLKPAVINAETRETAFVRMDGVFKAFCREAADDLSHNYYFVIDEINRADLSRVFGELMYCLDESYRGEENKIKTQYDRLPTYYYPANSDVAEVMQNDIFKDGFYIPENLVIIGTMNDIDRSVESFDFALRRRFQFINVDADVSLELLKDRLNGEVTNITDFIDNHAKKLNKVIGNAKDTFKLGNDFKLGQSYFSKYKDSTEHDNYDNYFEDELKQILEEYVRGRNGGADFIKECRTAFRNGPKPQTDGNSQT
ncbi:MAG: AAA family ATPase [Ruminococcus sp.]|nr:AAA family ATPase [Ruminococcus sp.]